MLKNLLLQRELEKLQISIDEEHNQLDSMESNQMMSSNNEFSQSFNQIKLNQPLCVNKNILNNDKRVVVDNILANISHCVNAESNNVSRTDFKSIIDLNELSTKISKQRKNRYNDIPTPSQPTTAGKENYQHQQPHLQQQQQQPQQQPPVQPMLKDPTKALNVYCSDAQRFNNTANFNDLNLQNQSEEEDKLNKQISLSSSLNSSLMVYTVDNTPTLHAFQLNMQQQQQQQQQGNCQGTGGMFQSANTSGQTTQTQSQFQYDYKNPNGSTNTLCSVGSQGSNVSINKPLAMNLDLSKMVVNRY